MKTRILRLFILPLLAFILVLALFPILFKGKLEEIARAELNKTTGIIISFDRLSVNAFRHFPNISATLHGLSLNTKDTFDSIASIKQARAAIDLSSILSKTKPLTITKIIIKDASLTFRILPSGASNFDFIFAERRTPQKPGSLKPGKKKISARLSSIVLQNMNLLWDDQSTALRFFAENLSLMSKGDYNEDWFHLTLAANIPKFNFSYGGIDYMQNVKIGARGLLEMNISEQTYRMKNGEIRLNELATSLEAEIRMKEEAMYTDLQFKTKENSFKSLLSLLPHAYTENFSEVKTEGFFDLEGSIKGSIDTIPDHFPSVYLRGSIRDGQFNYPDLPLGIMGINATLAVNHPGKNLDKMVVSLPQIKFLLDGQPFEAGMKARELISNPFLDFFAEGSIDLHKLSKAFPFPEMNSMGGLVQSKIQLSGTHTNLKTDGDIEIQGFSYKGNDMPVLSIDKIQSLFTDHQISIHARDGMFAKTRFGFDLVLPEPFSFMNPQVNIPVEIKLYSPEINLDNWLPQDSWVDSTNTETKAQMTYLPDFIDRLQISLIADAGKIVFQQDTTRANQLIANIVKEKIEFTSFTGIKNNSDWNISGNIEGIYGYLLEQKTLNGKLNIESKYLNFNDFVNINKNDTLSETPSEITDNPNIPANLNILIEAGLEQLIFGNLSLKEVKGLLRLGNNLVSLEDFTARGLGGQIQLSGSYSSPKSKPAAFAFYYDLQKIDFQESFKSLNTFRVLFPIGNYIAGSYSSNLFLSGNLGKGLVPDTRSMEGKGYLETHNAIVTDLPILNELGKQLNIRALQQSVNIGSSKNWFELREGFVEVPDFHLQAGQTDMVVGGRHGIDQRLDYTIQTAIPAQRLRESILPKNILSALKLKDTTLVNETNDLNLSVTIKIEGTVERPKLKVNKLGYSEAQKENSGQNLPFPTTNTEKPGILIDSLKAKAGEALDELRPDTLEKTIEDIKKELEKLNPFKKKKKNED